MRILVDLNAEVHQTAVVDQNVEVFVDRNVEGQAHVAQGNDVVKFERRKQGDEGKIITY